MAPMQQRRCLVGSQPLGQKTERAICDHIHWIDHPYALILPDRLAQPEQQNDVKEYLQFAGRPADGKSRYESARTAAADDAVDPCAHQCEDHADNKHIKYIRRFAFGELRAKEIEQRKKEYAAKQAHIARFAHVKAHFDNGKGLYAQHTANCMQHRQQQCGGPLDTQSLLAEQQPDEGKG